jgi:hypothetical protein
MRFMVDHDAGMAKANEVDASGGPGPMLSKIMDGSNQKWSFPKRQRAVPTSLST